MKHNGDAKYVVVGISDSKSGTPKAFVSYGFVTIDLAYHSEIFEVYAESLRRKSPTLRATVLGGGIVTINSGSKTVRTYGTSGGYGSTSLALLKYVVALAFPDYDQDVTITRYVRG